MENGVVPTVSGYDWPADRSVLFHSRVVAVNGVSVKTGADIYAAVATVAPGEAVFYRFEKKGIEFTLELPARRFTHRDFWQTYGILFIFGTVSWVIGVTVGFLQPATRQARVFLLHTMTIGLYPITAVFLHHPEFDVLNRACLILEAMLGATFVHLGLVFPLERPRTGLVRAIIAGAYGAAAILAARVLLGFRADPPDLDALYAVYVFTALALSFCIMAIGYAYVENSAPAARARIKAVIPGALLAAGVQIFIFLNNAASGGDLPVQFGLLTPLPYYASVAFAISRHDLFDIDRLVRQSFVYGLLSAIVLVAYALVLAIPAQIVPALGERGQVMLGMIFILVLAFSLSPLRDFVQGAVDRTFYRQRADYRATIRSLSEILTTLLDANEISSRVTRVVTDAMQLGSTVLWLPADDEATSEFWEYTAQGVARRWIAPIEFGGCATEILSPDGPIWQRLLEYPEPIHRRAVESIRRASTTPIPLLFRERLNGCLMLGAKRSGHPFGADDLDLLSTLANQVAIALENARSFRALDRLNRDLDEKVRQQTDELRQAQAQLIQSEKMASLGRLVAGVAHELNNPVSFVCGSLANLADYVDQYRQVIHTYGKMLAQNPAMQCAVAAVRSDTRLDYLLDATPHLLRICAEGSDRITRIVGDLRTFARADQGERSRVNVIEGIESTLLFLDELIARSGVRLIRDYSSVPPINADPNQLSQVWMNLLANAIDAVEGRERCEITVTVRENEDQIEVTIGDTGVGISAENQSRIFEPFFTTKPIGHGTGLGLSIVYGAVKGHGGTVEIDSVPGEGTAVTVRLRRGDG